MNFNINNVTKKFKNNGIENISITFDSKDIVGFVGPNGAGKTTTMKSIFGEYILDSGEIRYGEKSFSECEPSKVIFLTDQTQLPQFYKVKDYILWTGALYKLSKYQTIERSDFLLESFNLKETKNKRIKELSLGMQKKLSIVLALMAKPEIIFMDEPTANLDVDARQEILEIIRNLNKKGIGFFITTHIIDELEEIINKLVIIQEGKIVYNDDYDKNDKKIFDIYKEKTKKNINSINTNLDELFKMK
ncbi:ABC transporter ATP-binding protein [Spiroplasma sp. BIUS-1]|uniref:ABC transporter ATP-binding protein n=1 Tax=Spiroplasma sp. BIUS-1 TaxID=216964 RepID=UPI001397414B|nr:ABC transporter ATP-binding protein [Spiroplasma sp. BIUS-1]QHX36519.1 ABC transporter ATP-binding protein [Spiroplasma sp. BIUS-1]